MDHNAIQLGGTADEVLLQLVNDAATWSQAEGPGAATVLVITDDADLRAAIHRRGGRSAGTRWLIGRMDRPRLAAPSVGNARPPKPPRLEQEAGREEEVRQRMRVIYLEANEDPDAFRITSPYVVAVASP